MLILGGRYGSIEPKSQKSYIHLEYEYALEKSKPLFAVVINKNHLEAKVKKDGTQAIELDHPDKLKEFRELVCSKMVRFWNDPKDIKLAILETIADFTNRPDLVGWIPGSESVDTGTLAEEIARLTKENSELRERVSRSVDEPTKYNGLTFEEMRNLLSKKDLLSLLIDQKSQLAKGLPYKYKLRDFEEKAVIELAEIGLVNITSNERAFLSDVGKQFLARYQSD